MQFPILRKRDDDDDDDDDDDEDGSSKSAVPEGGTAFVLEPVPASPPPFPSFLPNPSIYEERTSISRFDFPSQRGVFRRL